MIIWLCGTISACLFVIDLLVVLAASASVVDFSGFPFDPFDPCRRRIESSILSSCFSSSLSSCLDLFVFLSLLLPFFQSSCDGFLQRQFRCVRLGGADGDDDRSCSPPLAVQLDEYQCPCCRWCRGRGRKNARR